jgi:hypothetical protein
LEEDEASALELEARFLAGDDDFIAESVVAAFEEAAVTLNTQQLVEDEASAFELEARFLAGYDGLLRCDGASGDNIIGLNEMSQCRVRPFTIEEIERNLLLENLDENLDELLHLFWSKIGPTTEKELETFLRFGKTSTIRHLLHGAGRARAAFAAREKLRIARRHHEENARLSDKNDWFKACDAAVAADNELRTGVIIKKVRSDRATARALRRDEVDDPTARECRNRKRVERAKARKGSRTKASSSHKALDYVVSRYYYLLAIYLISVLGRLPNALACACACVSGPHRASRRL